MKTQLSFTMLSCFILAAVTKTTAQKADEDAIKNVIQEETCSYLTKYNYNNGGNKQFY